jgi:hypothetical protein
MSWIRTVSLTVTRLQVPLARLSRLSSENIHRHREPPDDGRRSNAPLSEQHLQIEPGNEFRENLGKSLTKQAITTISDSKIISGRFVTFSAGLLLLDNRNTI